MVPGPEPPTALELRPGVYHGFGLFPVGLGITPLFILPSVFAKTGYVKRRLTLPERLLCYDFPKLLGVQLLPSQQRHLVMFLRCSSGRPGKCLLAAAKAFEPWLKLTVGLDTSVMIEKNCNDGLLFLVDQAPLVGLGLLEPTHPSTLKRKTIGIGGDQDKLELGKG